MEGKRFDTNTMWRLEGPYRTTTVRDTLSDLPRYCTVPQSQGDPKIVKRGPKGDPIFGKKGTQRGPVFDVKGDLKFEFFRIVHKERIC